MKKNGIKYLENYSLDDGRVGYRFPANIEAIRKACDAWLEKNTPPSQKKRRRRFGSY